MTTKDYFSRFSPSTELFRCLMQSCVIFLIFTICSFLTPRYNSFLLPLFYLSLTLFVYTLIRKVERQSLSQYVFLTNSILFPQILGGFLVFLDFVILTKSIFAYFLLIFALAVYIYGFIKDIQTKYSEWLTLIRGNSDSLFGEDGVRFLYSQTVYVNINQVKPALQKSLNVRRILRPLVVMISGGLISELGNGGIYYLVIILLCGVLYAISIVLSNKVAFYLLIRQLDKDTKTNLKWDKI